MSLRERLILRIRAEGPLRVSDYMEACLLDPDFGYYATRDPFGAGGDFITAPEISQMFGELVGLALAQSWLDQGAPSPVTLAEFGPGRGTLMADILRATRVVPGFHAALQVVLAEASPVLRAIQSETLAPWPVQFIDHAERLSETPLLLVANEFFDALPIRQFVRDGALWRERVIGLTGESLAFGLSPPAPCPVLDHRLADTEHGDLVELCPAMAVWLDPVTARIKAHGGAAVIIDYGGGPSLGDTLQALSAHRFAGPLADPGQADLTAHVDFVALADHARRAGLQVSAITLQGDLLNRLGIRARADRLGQLLSGADLSGHENAFHRLTSPQEMGTLFKAVALAPQGATLPPGFAS